MPTLTVISGASRGLGAAIARSAAAAGDSVVSVSRSAPAVGRHLECDLTDPVPAGIALAAMLRAAITPDITAWVLINNAGMIEPIGTSVDAGEVVRSINLNLTAHIVLTRAFIDTLREAPERKVVINISSGAATSPLHGWSVYCAAKAGLEHFGRTVALEQRDERYPVEVVNISPGIIDTDMQAAIRSATPERFPQVERFREFHTTGELAAPSDVAAKIMTGLASGTRYHGESVSINEFAGIV